MIQISLEIGNFMLRIQYSMRALCLTYFIYDLVFICKYIQMLVVVVLEKVYSL